MELRRPNRTEFSEETRRLRVEKLRQKTGSRLSSLNVSGIDARSVSGNIENFIGTTQIPLGLVGPLLVDFGNTQESITAPFATSEGALVSSVTRGSLAISLSGGVTSRVISNRMIRAPQFQFSCLDDALNFVNWVHDHDQDIKDLVKTKSAHARLIEIETKIFGRTVHVRFIYTTGDAAGQNMTTFCTAYLCNWILQQIDIETDLLCTDQIIEGNLANDKKVSSLTAYEGRGRTVMVETVISAAVLKRVLKLTAEEMINRFSRSKSSRIFTGQIGYNINVANVVAGLFLATGQDMACVHECSLGEFHIEQQGQDVYACLYMPSLIVGTVGGGTQLPSARDAIELLSCQNAGGADRLAQIIAGFSLALELSTVSAIGGGQFVGAHQRLARQFAMSTFKSSDLSLDFFNSSLIKDHDEKVISIKKINANNKQGYTNDMAFQSSKKLSGLMAFEIKTENSHQQKLEHKVFLKVKAKDDEIINGAVQILQTMNPQLAVLLQKNANLLPFKGCHTREMNVMAANDPVISKMSPRYFGSFSDTHKDVYVLIEEFLENTLFISEVKNLNVWTMARREQVIAAITNLHAKYWNNESLIEKNHPSFLNAYAGVNTEQEADFWEAYFCFIFSRLPYEHNKSLFSFYEKAIAEFTDWMTELSQVPHTLLHNDFNSRNIAFRVNEQTDTPVVFDWEFLAKGPASRDVVEFILFTSSPENIVQDMQNLSEIHLSMLSSILGHKVATHNEWRRLTQLSLKDFVVRRLPFYFILSEIGNCSFMERLIQNLKKLSEIYND